MILKDLKEARASWVVTGHPRLKRIQIFRIIFGVIIAVSISIHDLKNNFMLGFDADSLTSWLSLIVITMAYTGVFYIITFPLVIIQINFDSEATEAVALTFCGYGLVTVGLSFVALFGKLLNIVFLENISEDFLEAAEIREFGIVAAVGLTIFFIGRVFAFFSVKLRDSERQGGEDF